MNQLIKDNLQVIFSE